MLWSSGTRAAAALAWLASLCLAQPRLEYRSPYCGPGGGSPPWACGLWPTTAAPRLGRPGSIVEDPDSGNRVLRVTGPGSFGEGPAAAFKVFDAGWRRAWNADSTRFLVIPWSNAPVRHDSYWLSFDGGRMALGRESGPLPGDLEDIQWDPTNPDLVVGLFRGIATSYNVRSGKYADVFDPSKTRWGSQPWTSSWGAGRVCIADGPQDKGTRIVCATRGGSKASVIDLRAQTIDGKPLAISLRGQPARLPASIGIHTIMLAPDGKWLAVDTHGNTMCKVPDLGGYSPTELFINLENGAGYEWNIACGGTHWAYGYDGVMAQSVTPRWTPTGADGPCNSDSRGIARRPTGADADSGFTILGPCAFFQPPTWAVNVHLSWLNNRAGERANQYPVLLATITGTRATVFLGNEIAAMEIAAPPYRGRIWRFAQTWNDPTRSQCGFLEYSSPSISPDGKWALYPSNWQGQTGPGGVCTGGNRTDVFLFELR